MKTSKILSIMALFVGAILFMGCPYSSTVPLSEASMKVADSYIGTWEKAGSEGETIEVKRTSATTMDVLQTSTYDGTVTTYHCYFTDINGTLFLNLKEDGEYASYYFYKLEKDGEFKIKVLEVTSYIRETFESSEAMKKFFAANMNNSYFYSTEETTYYKVK
jgi:hypothetical protein